MRDIEPVGLALYNAGCVQFRDESKGEELFILKSGKLSNFYIDLSNRIIRHK